jgi:hypothetical protein
MESRAERTYRNLEGPMRAAAWQTDICLPSFLPFMGAVYIEQVLRAYGAF